MFSVGQRIPRTENLTVDECGTEGGDGNRGNSKAVSAAFFDDAAVAAVVADVIASVG